MSDFKVIKIFLKEIENKWTLIVMCHNKTQQESILSKLKDNSNYKFVTFFDSNKDSTYNAMLSLVDGGIKLEFRIDAPNVVDPDLWVKQNVRQLVVGFLDPTSLLEQSPVLSLEPNTDQE